MTFLGSAESWLPPFSGMIGVRPVDMALVKSAEEIFQTRPQPADEFSQSLEFSFCASPDFSSSNRLRYVIDVSALDVKDVSRLVDTGVAMLRDIPQNATHNRAFRRLETFSDKAGNRLLYGIGAEHVSDGSVSGFKTYWRSHSPLEALQDLLDGTRKKTFESLIGTAQAFWPRWEDARLIGIDYLASAENRVKAYLPQKGFDEPLSLVAFCEFLLRLGWRVDLDTFPKLAYLLLGRRTQVDPTAYSLGFAIGTKPSIKLEIAVKAYFNDNLKALNAVSRLAQSLTLDPSPIRIGVAALEKRNPLARPPVAEVICVDFSPNGGHRVILYCGL